MDKKKALQNLLDIKSALGSKPRWWIDCGTLLGAVREGDFIDHDVDTDIGMFAEDWDNVIIDRLEYLGFKLLHKFGYDEAGAEYPFSRDGVKTDIFLYYKEEDTRYFACWKNGFRNGMSDMIKMPYPEIYFDKIVPHGFKGEFFPVPIMYDEVLTHRYGNWREVDKNFKWDKSPLNIK